MKYEHHKSQQIHNATVQIAEAVCKLHGEYKVETTFHYNEKQHHEAIN